ncbi:hypothetical protein [Labrys wisconsinensis]|uniref:Uncharacterized protein n=1 Tax=Labrys wisconsinensis TaxID=425677 RepID=A0ABU0JHZ6_9HYPH|nr:hypothetical protein [Labrys wisconsinensis]MDQ0473116.1 hypothetical protein [Labrys wisconsinensis]
MPRMQGRFPRGTIAVGVLAALIVGLLLVRREAGESSAGGPSCPPVAVALGAAVLRVPVTPMVRVEAPARSLDLADADTVAALCTAPAPAPIQAMRIELDFDRLDQDWPSVLAWRGRHCGAPAGLDAFLCTGESRPPGTPRQLARAMIVAAGNGAALDGAPRFADVRSGVAAAGGRFDRAGNIRVERPGRGSDPAAEPAVFVCDAGIWPVGSAHYCRGTIGLPDGLLAGFEFRAPQQGIEDAAVAAIAHMRDLLAVMRANEQGRPAAGEIPGLDDGAAVRGRLDRRGMPV